MRLLYIWCCFFFLMLAGCAEKPSPTDDFDLVSQRFGSPDADDSTMAEVPPPPQVSRWITYKKERVRFFFMRDGRGWHLVDTADPVTKTSITPDAAVKRLAGRDHNSVGASKR